MIIDMRYHLASLVAVFLALGLGIMIGISLNSDGRLVNEQASLIDAIDAQLQHLKLEKEDLSLEAKKAADELSFYREFLQATLPAIVDGQLRGKSVAVLNLGTRNLAEVVGKVIEQSGARVITANVRNETELAAFVAAISDEKAESLVLVGDSSLADLAKRTVQMVAPLGIKVFAAGAGELLKTLGVQGVAAVERAETVIGQITLVQKIAGVSSDGSR